MSKKLPVNNLSGSKILLDLMKSSFNEVNVQILKNCITFLPEKMKIVKVEKLVANLHGKTEYVIDIRNLKQALNHGLIFKKFHRVIQLNQNAWLKPFIDMNTDLRKKKQKLIWKRKLS